MVAAQLRDELAGTLTIPCALVDVRADDRDGTPIPGVEVADLIDPDRSAIRAPLQRRGCGRPSRLQSGRAVSGASGALTPSTLNSTTCAWPATFYRSGPSRPAVETSVVMAELEPLRRTGTTHALIHSGKAGDWCTRSSLPLADNFYGWAKAILRTARLSLRNAASSMRQSLEPFVQIRIGAPRDVAGVASTRASSRSSITGVCGVEQRSSADCRRTPGVRARLRHDSDGPRHRDRPTSNAPTAYRGWWSTASPATRGRSGRWSRRGTSWATRRKTMRR